MVPLSAERYFVVEKPGLDVAHVVGGDEPITDD